MNSFYTLLFFLLNSKFSIHFSPPPLANSVLACDCVKLTKKKKAAEQLEKETKELRPDLWDEYQAKLGEGETMATRPDLLQELGNIMQPLLVEKEARMAAGQQQNTNVADVSTQAPPPPPPTTTVTSDNVVDVEVVSKEEDQEEPLQ